MDEVIFAEQTLAFYYESSRGAYANNSNPALFLPVVGETYNVVWDGSEYSCTAYTADSFPGMILLGNTLMINGTNTGEPFVIASIADGSGMSIFAMTAEETHTMAVYQGSIEEETPEGIVLKDYAGNEVIYSEVKSIKIPTSSGGTQMFIAGEPVEKVVDLAMADGDQVIEADENTLLTKVTVRKPETLIPENIAKDVDVGGVVGTHEGGSVSSGDYTITIVDYDGTVLLEEKHATGDVVTLPDAPTHDRLVFDGWSASVPITDNTVTVEENDIMVGAMYRTTSGATELDIELTSNTGLAINFSSVLTGYTSIDWGDGVKNATLTHTYSNYGKYTIKIYGMTKVATTSSSRFVTRGLAAVKNVFLSNTVSSVGDYFLAGATSVKNVTLSNNLTSIGNYAFNSCNTLLCAILPCNLTKITLQMFYVCYALETVIIPRGVASIGIKAFYQCYSLKNITIPDSVISIESEAFYQCYSLKNITIPDSVINIYNRAFYQCYALEDIIISANIQIITQCFLYNCSAIKKIALPNVKSIETYAFQNMYSCKEFDFSRCTDIPTLAGTNVFSVSNPSSQQIKVPASLYDSWVVATNWSNLARYIVAV